MSDMWPTLESVLEAALAFVLAWLSVPSVLAVLALVALILFGLGRGLGLPRLFWSTSRWPQFAAGAATAALFLEVELVVYLLGAHSGFPALKGAVSFTVASSLCWLFLVLLAARGVGSSRTSEAESLPERRTSPAIRQSTDTGPSFRRHEGVSPLPFLVGSVLTVAALLAAAFLVLELPAVSLPPPLAIWFPEPATLDPRLHNVAFAGAIGFGVLFLFWRKTAPAAVALCCLLALVVAVHGFFSFFLQASALEFLVLGGLLLVSGRVRYKLRLRDLAADYVGKSLHPYPPQSALPAPELLSFDTPLRVRLEKASRRPLVVVCTSGGGIRAATWTAAILGRLDELPHMRRALSWVSGASGGMVGAAHWLACRVADKAVPWESLAKGVALDSLTAVARTLVFHDVPLAFLPVPNLRDRGQALQAAWSTHAKKLGGNLAAPLSSLRQGEGEGRFPSLVFSPMLVEDGRRLLLTNVDLSPVTDHYARWLSSAAKPGSPSTGLASRSAYSLADLVPGALSRVSLATAARLVASFPYASPAVSLPTTPRRRVVDAGYFDNYGLELACGWLRMLLERCRENLVAGCSGILIIQIRDNVSELSVNPQSAPEFERLRENAAEGDTATSRGLEGLTSPPEAVLSARNSATLFRNDAQLEAVSSLYAEAFKQPDFVTTTVFEFAGEASLSWHLDCDEVHSLLGQAASTGITGKLDAVRHWLAAGTRPSSQGQPAPPGGPTVLPGTS
jgi:hypothetical protein